MSTSAKYVVSIKEKDYLPENNTKFTSKEIKTTELREIVKNKNYSFITWKNGERLIENFKSAEGATIDIDSGLTIPKAIERLQHKDLNYLIVTSKSHTKEKHRYHIIILFKFPVYNVDTYRGIVNKLREYFPESDKAALDPARFIFGSPDDCEIHDYWNGEDYDTSTHKGLWDRTTPLYDGDDNLISVEDSMEKTPIKCPFHNDNNPSAFVQPRSNNFFIHCSSCDRTFWMFQNVEEWLSTICKDYYSYGTDIWDFGITEEDFNFSKIGKEKFFILTGTIGTPNAKMAYEYLVKHKHIRNLTKIEYIGDINTEHSFYESDVSRGIFSIHYKAIQPKIKDNKLVEQYLEDRFGKYKKFIKDWLAMYCYTNFLRLPTLVFFGRRGGGKTSFADIISAIFPSLSFQWTGKEENFTYEKEKKFVVVEENSINKISQYQTIKKYSGSEYFNTNKKFKDPYQIRNNMNICLLSNDSIPLFVKTSEMPTSERNNQFFVYEFPELSGKLSNRIKSKVLSRMGHYIRTELRDVYKNLPDREDLRYYIPVPITPYEKELFINNATETDHEINEVINNLQDLYVTSSALDSTASREFLKNGYVLTSWLKDNYPRSHSLIKNMARADLILAEPKRVKVGPYRRQAFQIKPQLEDKLKEVEDENPLD